MFVALIFVTMNKDVQGHRYTPSCETPATKMTMLMAMMMTMAKMMMMLRVLREGNMPSHSRLAPS